MQKAQQIINEIKKVIVGKDAQISKVLMTVLARGHILIDDIPGVGKTTLALSFSKAIALDYQRIQFTPDVMPSDVVGFSMLNKKTNEFEYKPGAAICNLLLADEINRTSSKTQAALLELMEEGKVTVDGVTRERPTPHIVIATQNPVGSAGTQLLPESQLDRFAIRLTIGYPDLTSEMRMMRDRRGANPMDTIVAVASKEDLLAMQNEVDAIHRSDAVYDYMARLARGTRENPLISCGLSPRGLITLSNMAAACAYMNGRNYVTPDDVRFVFADVCAHRMVMSPQAKLSGVTADAALEKILASVPVPKIVTQQ